MSKCINIEKKCTKIWNMLEIYEIRVQFKKNNNCYLQGIQNDLKFIAKGKFKLEESVGPVLEELNKDGNRVILW